MRVLAIDTSSARTSVAMVVNGRIEASAEHADPRRHVEVLAPLIAEAIDAPELIAVGVGPGPYTGLRGGIVTALVLGEALGVPVVGICSLDAVAAAVAAGAPGAPFIVTADARRREVYWAAYTADGVRIDGPYVGPIALVEADERGLEIRSGLLPEASRIGLLAAEAIERGDEMAPAVADLAPHGADGAATARALAGRTLLQPAPLYLRKPDAAGAA